MGSVLDYEKCPKCEGVLMVNYYYRSGEEYHHCHRCGYHLEHTMKRDEKGEVIFTEVDGRKVQDMQTNSSEGYGTYRIMTHEGGGQGGGFGAPITEEQLQELKEILSRSEINEERSHVIRFVDGMAEILLGKPDDISFLSFVEFNKKMEETHSQPEPFNIVEN